MTRHQSDRLGERAKAVCIESVAKAHGFWSTLKRQGAEYVGPCPVCGGTDRFALKDADNLKKQQWHCRGCDDGGRDAISFAAFLHSLDYKGEDFPTICKIVLGEPVPIATPAREESRREFRRDRRHVNGDGEHSGDDGDGKGNGADKAAEEVETEVEVGSPFVYGDESGVPLFETRRVEYRRLDGSPVFKNGKLKKIHKPYRYDAGDHPVLGLIGARVVPYHLSRLITAVAAGKDIFIAEGEAKVDLLHSLGFEATCGPGGTSGFKWWSDHAAFLRGANVVVMPDNDKPGANFANKVAALLADGIAASVRWLALDDVPAAGDVKDWVARGHTGDELAQLATAAPLWEPPVELKSEAGPAPETEKPTRTLEFECMADVVAKPVQWVWPGRFARGKLTLVAGDPGMGKSQIGMAMTAAITKTGRWPDGSEAPHGSVIILSSEDAGADTIKPRLLAAGADPKKVHRLSVTKTADGQYDTFSLQADLDRLGKKVEAVGDAVIVIIDPITSYMGDIDSHQTTKVRSVLEPVANFADRYNVVIFGVSHPPKAVQSKALNSITGSLAFVAAARLVFIAVDEPETTLGRKLLLAVKNNLGPKAKGLGYRILGTVVQEDGQDIVTSYVDWDTKPVQTTADQALALLAASTSAYALNDAVEFLKVELAGGPMPTKAVLKAASDAGISKATLFRAKERLKIKPRKIGLTGGWQWELPRSDSLTRDDGLPFTDDGEQK